MHKVIHTFFTPLSVFCFLSLSPYLLAYHKLTVSYGRYSSSGSVFDEPLLTTADSIAERHLSIHQNLQDSILQQATEEKLFSLQEIVVTSSRIPKSPEQMSSSTYIIPKEELQNSNSASLAGILSSVAGVFVKEYGGVSGLKTISQRGMGTEHTLVLVNGVRVNSMQNGLVDLGLFSLDDIEGVEILSGGNSAAYGSDAVAGVVNILTDIPQTDHAIAFTSALGSFGYKRMHLIARGSAGPLLLQGTYGEENSEEDYPFHFTNGNLTQTVNRRNSDLRAQFGSLKSTINLDGNTRMNILIHGYGSERGTGGPVLAPTSTSRARQKDEQWLAQVSVKSRFSHSVELSTHFQSQRMYQRYRDPELVIGGITVDNHFTNLHLLWETEASIVLDEKRTVCAGFELAYSNAKGNSLKSDVTREQMALFGTADIQFPFESGMIAGVGLQPGLRFDLQAGGLQAWSPQLGAVVSFRRFDSGFLQNLDVSAFSSISRNFRSPTFNELYYSGGGGVGNPRLQPERSTGFDAGIRGGFDGMGRHRIQASYFRISMQDRIVWVAAGPGAVSPKNLRKVLSEGFEASSRHSALDDAIILKTAFTQTRSIKISSDYESDPTTGNQLVYVPEQTVHTSLMLVKRWDMALLKEVAGEIRYSFTGFRYFTEDNAGFLPSYRLVDVNIRANLAPGEFAFLTKFEVNNLLNENYQVTPGFPMPLRSYRLTVIVEW